MTEDLRGFRRLVGENAAFRRMWISHMISLIGDWLSYIAVAVVSIERGDGALAVGMVLLVHSLPTALTSPISGPLADRLDRKKLLIAGYLGASVLTLGMWGAAEHSMVWLLQGILFLRVCMSGLSMTARTAAIPALVGREDLRLANALLGLTWSLMFTLGLALGGFATEWLSPSGAILLDALTFILAALVAASLPALQPELGEEGPPRPGLADMMRAWRFIQERPLLLSQVLSKTPSMVANAGAWVTLNLVAGERLSPMSTAVALGVLQSVRAVGTGLGPLVPARLIPRNHLVGVVLALVGMALFVGVEAVWASVLGLFLWGAGQGHNWVVSTAEIQAATPDHLLGRVSSLDFLLFSFSASVAALLTGWICDLRGDPGAGAWVMMGAAALLWSGCVLLARQAPESRPSEPPPQGD